MMMQDWTPVVNLAIRKYFHELHDRESIRNFCSPNVGEFRDHAVHPSKQTSNPLRTGIRVSAEREQDHSLQKQRRWQRVTCYSNDHTWLVTLTVSCWGSQYSNATAVPLCPRFLLKTNWSACLLLTRGPHCHSSFSIINSSVTLLQAVYNATHT